MEKEILRKAFNAGIYKATGDTDVTYINGRPTFDEWYDKVVLPQANVSRSLPLSELKDTLCEVSQLIAGWNATEAQWSKWDEEVKQKVYELQKMIDGKQAVNFC